GRRLGGGLLVTVLGDVGDPEFGEQPYVRRGEGLGDRDERDVLRVPPTRHAGLLDASPYLRQVGGEFVLASDHLLEKVRDVEIVVLIEHHRTPAGRLLPGARTSGTQGGRRHGGGLGRLPLLCLFGSGTTRGR